MRSVRFLILAVALGLTGCPPGGTPPRHIHDNPHQHMHAHHVNTTWCKDLACNRVVYIDSNCNLTDASGNAVTAIDALIGTRICFFNHSGCSLVLKFDATLFGESRSRVTLGNDECVNLTVNTEAGGNNYLFTIICDCVEGSGHGNPEIKVGGGTEGGG